MPTTPNPSSGGLRLRRSLSRSTKLLIILRFGNPLFAEVLAISRNFVMIEGEDLIVTFLAALRYDQLLKASHAFNILDARGFVGVTERARYFARMRSLARQCAQLWLKTREALGHPLGFSKENYLLFQNLPNSQLQKVLERPGAFVLEIGTEEMPPHDVVEASNQLRSLTVEYLKKRRLSCGEVSSYGTPRRLVFSYSKSDIGTFVRLLSLTEDGPLVLSKLQFAGCVKNQYYTQTQYDEMRIEWREFVYSYLK
ncbi:glycine--tRNA ligase, chloroplastic/mitochondrial 2-like [Zingiber officinale]|uniref:glycine--tRNA ligase, chloroplastic/mitochondrial 2-like n=1 Tax=Zingiber officinale TaxID=94328 RepID=UPI001C4B3743|nr:glycine--tRNA ligase, chloroplastic/mitochondrial 2-like [Zingiber officinale]